MVTQIFAKQQTQRVIKDLRAAGYTVEKKQSGIYECHLDGELIFAAMPGSRGYLVRYDQRLLTPVTPQGRSIDYCTDDINAFDD